MNKECCACRYFTAYYTKAYSCFLRTDCGDCDLCKSTVQKHSSCEKFKCKIPRKRDISYVVRSIGDTLVNLNAIKLILEEDREEK